MLPDPPQCNNFSTPPLNVVPMTAFVSASGRSGSGWQLIPVSMLITSTEEKRAPEESSPPATTRYLAADED